MLVVCHRLQAAAQVLEKMIYVLTCDEIRNNLPNSVQQRRNFSDETLIKRNYEHKKIVSPAVTSIDNDQKTLEQQRKLRLFICSGWKLEANSIHSL